LSRGYSVAVWFQRSWFCPANRGKPPSKLTPPPSIAGTVVKPTYFSVRFKGADQERPTSNSRLPLVVRTMMWLIHLSTPRLSNGQRAYCRVIAISRDKERPRLCGYCRPTRRRLGLYECKVRCVVGCQGKKCATKPWAGSELGRWQGD